MVEHIVLWTFREGVDKEECFAQLVALFDSFKREVPGMQSLQLHRGYQGYDVCLISVHDSREALEEYQNFPAHLRAKEIVKANREHRASCDFTL